LSKTAPNDTWKPAGAVVGSNNVFEDSSRRAVIVGRGIAVLKPAVTV
jgi:hypothetical protein